MILNLKRRKCKKCRTEFQPKTEWQKYCGGRCRWTVANQKKVDLIRRAKKIIDAAAAGQQ